MSENCKQCKYFHTLNFPPGRGQCRANTPAVRVEETGIVRYRAASIWPEVLEKDWCGRFKSAAPAPAPTPPPASVPDTIPAARPPRDEIAIDGSYTGPALLAQLERLTDSLDRLTDAVQSQSGKPPALDHSAAMLRLLARLVRGVDTLAQAAAQARLEEEEDRQTRQHQRRFDPEF